MTIRTRFAMPLPVYYHLLPVYGPGSADVLFAAFCRSQGITDRTIRAKALADETSITEACRRMLMQYHPDVYTLWPSKRMSPALVKATARRIAAAPEEDSELTRACKYIMKLIKNPDHGHTKYRAREFAEKHLQRLDTVWKSSPGADS
jgi:hypothetical protein